jgi:ZIP family zinc transporter
LGALAASSLVIGALIALRFQIGLRTIGLVMGFGAGVLISAVAFDLIQEAADKSSGHGSIAVGIFAGYAVFYGGDRLIDRLGGGDRKDATGDQQSGSALAIVLGTVLDGIPESMVIGLTIFEGGAVGAAYLAAVFISNLPESISSTTGLASGGWKKSRILWMWIGIALVSGLASLAGYGLFQDSSPDTVAVVLAFAAGAILTMLANTMMPEAFEHGGKLVGSSPRSASRSPTRSTPSVEVYELNTPRAAHHIGALPKTALPWQEWFPSLFAAGTHQRHARRRRTT